MAVQLRYQACGPTGTCTGASESRKGIDIGMASHYFSAGACVGASVKRSGVRGPSGIYSKEAKFSFISGSPSSSSLASSVACN